MIAKIKLEFWSPNKLKFDQLTEEMYEQIRHLLPGLPATKPAYYSDLHHEMLVELDVVGPLLMSFNIGFELLAFPHNMLVKMEEQFDRLGRVDRMYATGALVQIHIPNLALMLVDEVAHLDDCCTDDLQKHLDEGWRLIAVCPPNAQRRPDYILGRTRR